MELTKEEEALSADVSSREEALDCLFGTAHVGEPKGRAYSDIPSMVLKYVIEAASGLNFMDCVRKTVLEPAGMRETWALVPEERRNDCQRYDGEYRIEGEKYIHRTGPEPGVPHDPKAAVIQGGTEDLCGHAGLFSTGGDMVRFCRAVLDGKIVSRASLREMAENRTGYLRKDGTYTQYLGYQCYVRHPQQYYSEIPRYMGRQAFGNAGFTGNHLSVGQPGQGPADGSAAGSGQDTRGLRTERGRERTLPVAERGRDVHGSPFLGEICAPEGRAPAQRRRAGAGAGSYRMD